jgi:hypothetical protein
MTEYYTNIKKDLEKNGAYDIVENSISDQKLLGFSIKANNKIFNLVIMHAVIDDRIIIQLFTSFHNSYIEPKIDFYHILDKLNMNCIIGNIYFTKEKENFYISYKSNYIGDPINFSGNNSFGLYLSSSLDMVSIFDNELNIL